MSHSQLIRTNPPQQAVEPVTGERGAPRPDSEVEADRRHARSRHYTCDDGDGLTAFRGPVAGARPLQRGRPRRAGLLAALRRAALSRVDRAAEVGATNRVNERALVAADNWGFTAVPAGVDGRARAGRSVADRTGDE
jgi:hypothetical protein